LLQAVCGESRPANSERPAIPSTSGQTTSRFLATATREQRAAMKRDLEPIINIYNQL
jgi:hypothetical protein